MSSVPHVAPPPPLPASSVKVGFSGKRGDFFRLVRNGTGLELITFGFYRFWLATDIRRHLWSHTSIEGDAPEYTGRGRELLIGFLFAMAILLPIYLAYFPGRFGGGTLQGLCQFSAVPVLLFVRAVRDLSCAALSPDAHRMARRALLDGWFGLGLCIAGVWMGGAGRDDAGRTVAVARSGARTLQDAALPLWRSARQF